MNKKGQLTQAQIVKYFLLVFGFLIIVSAIFLNLDLFGFTEEASCELSVLTRATSLEALKDELPLKCDTKKICLTGDKSEKCKESFTGEKKIEIVKLNNDVIKNKNLIEKTLADEMYKCWDTFGEGRLDIFGDFSKLSGKEEERVSCVICSRIAIDKDSDKLVKKENLDLGEFLRKEKVGNTGLTYLQYFSDKGVNNYPSFNKESFEKNYSGFQVNSLGSEDKDEVAIVFTQIKPNDYKKILGTLGSMGVVAVGGTFLFGAKTGIGTLIGKETIRKFIFSSYVLIPTAVYAGGKVLYSVKQVYDGRVTVAGYCGEFVSASDDENDPKAGCSIVQIVPYDFREINNLCGGGIQGNP